MEEELRFLKNKIEEIAISQNKTIVQLTDILVGLKAMIMGRDCTCVKCGESLACAYLHKEGESHVESMCGACAL